MTLTGKQKRFLRAMAHPLSPVLQVGKQGVTANVLEQLDLALESHELIKVSVLETSPLTRDEVGEIFVEETGAHWVQSIGRLVILYRESLNNPQIQLPRT